MTPFRRCDRRVVWLALLVVASLATARCSVRTFVVNRVGNALASGSGTFASDDDPVLVGQALPFSLELVESLIVQSPRHRPLLLTATSGFTQYCYGWVQEPADELSPNDYEAAKVQYTRARKLYLRARDYGIRAIDPDHPDRLRAALLRDPVAALAHTSKRDVPALYWTAASWALAISISKDDPELVADLPIVDALIRRADTLDDTWNHGSIPAFLISWEMARPNAGHDAEKRARAAFDRAIALSKGELAAPYVSLAESVALEDQNRKEFVDLLNKALAIDPDKEPSTRMENLIAQRRAKWLLGRLDDLFLDSDGEGGTK